MESKSLALRTLVLTLHCTVLTTAWTVTRPIPVLEHDNVTLLCAVEGTMWAGQQIDWYYNSQTHIYRYEGQDRHIGYGNWATRAQAGAPFQLTIRNVSVSDDGFYTCDVGFPSNDVRTIRSAVNVAVPTGSLEILPTNTTFKEGTVVNISCIARGGKPTPNLRWINHTENSNYTQTRALGLSVNISAENNQQHLICEERQFHPLLGQRLNQQGTILNVLYRPRIRLEIKEGKSLTISCSADANPPPTHLQIIKGNKTLPVTHERESNVQYTKSNVQMSDAGKYQCVAANYVGTSIELLWLDYNCVDTGECELVEHKEVIPTADTVISDDNKEEYFLYLVIPVAAGVVLGSVLWLIIYGVKKRKRRKDGYKDITVQIAPRNSDTSSESSALVSIDDDRPPMPLPRPPKSRFPKFELVRQCLDMDTSRVLGRGAFGKVYKGTLTGVNKNPIPLTVAVKTIKDCATEDELQAFYDEISIITEMGSHLNILHMHGCCTTHDPDRPLLVMEYMEYGDLLHFLEKCREVKNGAPCDDPMYEMEDKTMYQIAHQVASGMQHICKQKYIHGDLAARNVLVSKGQTIVVKISDFGLTEDIYQKGYQRQDPDQRIPIKWISLERLLLNGRCTEKSDVWSFGILLYEIVTLGGPPYPTIPNVEILQYQLRQGWRMERPEGCQYFLYECMKSCWKERPMDRPTFSQLKDNFDKVLMKFYTQYSTVIG